MLRESIKRAGWREDAHHAYSLVDTRVECTCGFTSGAGSDAWDEHYWGAVADAVLVVVNERIEAERQAREEAEREVAKRSESIDVLMGTIEAATEDHIALTAERDALVTALRAVSNHEPKSYDESTMALVYRESEAYHDVRRLADAALASAGASQEAGDPQHPTSDSCDIVGDHDHDTDFFYGVFAPSWRDDQLLVGVLRDDAMSQDTERDQALLLHVADRLEALTATSQEAGLSEKGQAFYAAIHGERDDVYLASQEAVSDE